VAALGDLGPDSISGGHPHLIEFASGERLTVSYNQSLDSIEIGGRVGLLSKSSIPFSDLI
jgi:hypothetical protein